jgi:hypothetical protein
MDRATADGLIDRYFDCIDALDYDGLGDLYTEDVELGWLDGRVIRGWDDVRAFYETERGERDTEHRLLERLHDGSRAAVEGEVRHTEDGTTDVNEFCDVFEFENGRIARVSVYPKA